MLTKTPTTNNILTMDNIISISTPLQTELTPCETFNQNTLTRSYCRILKKQKHKSLTRKQNPSKTTINKTITIHITTQNKTATRTYPPIRSIKNNNTIQTPGNNYRHIGTIPGNKLSSDFQRKRDKNKGVPTDTLPPYIFPIYKPNRIMN